MTLDVLRKAEVMITRSCNLRCHYCRTIYPFQPQLKELSIEKWKKAFRILANQKVFASIIGGEPTSLGDGLVELVRYFAEIKLRYAITSNCTLLTEKYAERLLEVGLDGWTASIDAVAGSVGTADAHSHLKSQRGYQWLKWFQERGVRDLVANMVITRKNIHLIPDMVRNLSDEGFWVITSPLNIGKHGVDEFSSVRYRFSSDSKFVGDLEWKDKDEVRKYTKILADMARSGKYRMHNVPEMYADFMPRFFRSRDWYCDEPSSICIDADGTLMCCVEWNIFDPVTKKATYSVFDLTDPVKREEIYQAFKYSNRKCSGCVWDSHFQTEELRKHPEEEWRYRHSVPKGA